MLYTPPSGATDANAPYVGKNVPAGLQGSKVPRGAVENPQREIQNAILATGQSPTNNDLTQLAQAIATGIDLGTLGGTANAIVDALPGSVPIPALREGFTVWGIIGSTNTGPVTLALNGFVTAPGTIAVVRKDGVSALAAGDLKAGDLVALRFDGTSFRHVGGVASDTSATISTLNITGSKFQIFSTPGTTTFTVPAGITNIHARVWGGGGGGAGGTMAAGAGGGYVEDTYAVTPGQTIAVTVGAGGVGTVGSTNSTNPGNPGGTSSFGAFCSATGGQGGGVGSTFGGSGSGGSIAKSGASGQDLDGTVNYAVGGASPFGGATSVYAGMFPGGGGGAAAPSSAGGSQGFNGASGAVILQF